MSNPELAKRYPLTMLSPKPHAFLNSQYANEDHQMNLMGEQKITIHPADAAARGIGDGDIVRLFNDRGVLEAPAVLSSDVPLGLVMANVGYWASKNTRSGTSVNVISSDKHSELGMAGTYSDNLVEVAKVSSS